MKVEDYTSALSLKQKNLRWAVKSGSLERVRELFQTFSELKEDKEWFDYWIVSTALKAGHSKIVEFLIQQDCRVKIPEETLVYCTPLYYACRLWDSELAEKLIKKGASIHDKDANTKTPIELAMQYKNTTMIDTILRCYNDGFVKDASWQDFDIFQLACWRGRLDIVEKFINQGINLSSPSVFKSRKWKGFSPLHFAVDGDHTAIYSILLKHDADLFAKNRIGDTPLHLAFKQSKHARFFCDNMIEEYSRILKSGSFQNPDNEEGLTFFHIICSIHSLGLICTAEQKKHMEQYLNIIRHFIDNEIDINEQVSAESQNHAGYSALHFSVSNSSLEISKLLLECGADPNRLDGKGRIPLHLVCEKFDPNLCFKFPNYKSDHEKIVTLLLQYGSKIDVADTVGGSTPLHIAFLNEAVNNSIVDLLLSEKQMATNFINSQGLSYFHIACSRGLLSAVRALVSSGASVHSRTHIDASYFTDWSALHFAVYFNQREIVNFLLARGADVNAKITHSKMTPLHFACEHRYTRFFQFSHLSDKSCNNFDPFSVDWKTSREDQYGIIESLLKCGASVNDRDSTGHTALILACRIPVDHMMKSYRGPSIAQDYYRKNVLNEIGIRQDHIVERLLRHGADIRARNIPVLHAIVKDIVDDDTFVIGEKMMEKLLDEGVDVNSVLLPNSITLLHLVAESCPDSCALKIMTMLLSEPNIDVDPRNCSGDTPLHIAARRRKGPLVKKLLDSGADINAENSNGFSPLKLFCNTLKKNRRDSDYGIIAGTMIIQVKKLMKLNFFVSEQVKQCLEILLRHVQKGSGYVRDRMKLLDEKIAAELETLKSKKIDAYTSLYDVLRKDANDMSVHVKNDNLEWLMRSFSLQTDFPAYHNMLELQFRTGIIRDSILESAREVLNFITKIDWPDPCSDHILKYLSYTDLEILVKSKIDQKLLKRKADECSNSCDNFSSKVFRPN